MPRNLRILDPEYSSWFLKEGKRSDGKNGYPINYRLLICHALSYFSEQYSSKNVYTKSLRIDGLDESVKVASAKTCSLEVVAELLQSAIASMDLRDKFTPDDFLEIYPLELKGGLGHVVVDQSNGCFPLVLYPERLEEYKGDRDTAFRSALEDVHGKIGDVWEMLSPNTVHLSWNEEFQKQLLRKFGFSIPFGIGAQAR